MEDKRLDKEINVQTPTNIEKLSDLSEQAKCDGYSSGGFGCRQ